MFKILLVEDEEAHAELVRRYLDPAYELTLASDGAQAIEEVRCSRPDLILLDIKLGPLSIDGWEVNRRLKSNPATATIPVVALTAHAYRQEHRERALAEGFTNHLSKPIDFDHLAGIIRGYHQRGVQGT